MCDLSCKVSSAVNILLQHPSLACALVHFAKTSAVQVVDLVLTCVLFH
jgi:hypothetical protein